MEQYISKNKIIEAIKRRRKDWCGNSVEAKYKREECDDILFVIDNLDVKEVNLHDKIYDYINAHYSEGCDGGMISDAHNDIGGVMYSDLASLAEHFYELGLKTAQKGE